MIAEGSAAAYHKGRNTARCCNLKRPFALLQGRPSAASATPELELVKPGKSGRSVYSTRLTESGCGGFLPVLLEAKAALRVPWLYVGL